MLPIRLPIRLSIALLLFAMAAVVQAADIQVTDPYARAVPPGQPNSAAFMRLENRSDAGRALVAARSPASAAVELHTHVQEDGMMRMRRIERIELPAKTPVALEPGGLHIMLIDLVAPLTPGGEVPLVLVFDDGGEIAIQAPVRQLQTMPARNH